MITAKPFEYKLLRDITSSSLNEQVNAALQHETEEWELFGPPALDNGYYCQAVIRTSHRPNESGDR